VEAGGSRVLAAAERAAAALAGPAAAAARVLDAAAGPLADRPLPWIAAAVAGVPLLRAALPAEAALAPCLLLAGAAGLALLLRAAAVLHAAEEGRWVARALVAGLLLRVVAAAVLRSRGGFPDEVGYYHPFARDAAADWAAGGDSLLGVHPISAGRWAYFGPLSAAYLLLGPVMEVGRLLGILVGLAGALLAGEVARPLGGARAAAIAAVLLALHPEHALWSATLSRDGLSALLVLAALAIALRHRGRLLRGPGLLLLGPLGLLAGNALPAAAALGGAIAVALLVEAAGEVRAGPAGALRAAAAVALVAAGAIAALGRLEPFLDGEAIARLRSGVFRGDLAALAAEGRLEADFLPGFRIEGPGDAALLAAAGIPFALLAPWPWDAVHLHRAAYVLPALLGAAVAILGLAGVAGALRRDAVRAAAPAAFAALALLALAVLEGNSGILVRHRLPLTAVLAAFAAVLAAGTEREALPGPAAVR
jgi:hypothetical protein